MEWRCSGADELGEIRVRMTQTGGAGSAVCRRQLGAPLDRLEAHPLNAARPTGQSHPGQTGCLPRINSTVQAGRSDGPALLSPVCLVAQSSLGSASSFQPHAPYSPFRGMPPYSQLAASSLLSQQYAASLGLGE